MSQESHDHNFKNLLADFPKIPGNKLPVYFGLSLRDKSESGMDDI